MWKQVFFSCVWHRTFAQALLYSDHCGQHIKVFHLLEGDGLLGDLIYKKNKKGNFEYVLINIQRWDGFKFHYYEICANGFCAVEWRPNGQGPDSPLQMRWNKKAPHNERRPWTVEGERKFRIEMRMKLNGFKNNNFIGNGMGNSVYYENEIMGNGEYYDPADPGYESVDYVRKGDNDDLFD